VSNFDFEDIWLCSDKFHGSHSLHTLVNCKELPTANPVGPWSECYPLTLQVPHSCCHRVLCQVFRRNILPTCAGLSGFLGTRTPVFHDPFLVCNISLCGISKCNARNSEVGRILKSTVMASSKSYAVICLEGLASATEVNNGGAIPPFPHTSSWHCITL
jgi:hypothetical protein